METIPSRVTIVTWPPLWQYWPAYLALARTKLHFKDQRLEFSFVTAPSPVTDDGLREKFDELHKRAMGFPTLALCEPFGVITSDLSTQEALRRLPLIWRQPHWILRLPSFGPQKSEPPSDGILYRFPPATTTGDFVDRVGGRLPMFQTLPRNWKVIEDVDLKDELGVVRSLRPQDAIVTFTPWHRILGPHCLTGIPSQWEFDQPLDSVQLAGPSRDVTAILIPESDQNFFVDYLAAQIKSVIGELTWTQGDPKLLGQMLAGGNFELVKTFLMECGFEQPLWMDEHFLCAALAEYVLLGCYFPYRTLDSAISVEIQKRVGEILSVLGSRALVEIHGAMANFLGGAPEWARLSFSERAFVYSSLHGRAESTGEGMSLAHILTHHRFDSVAFRSTLSDLQIKTSVHSPTYQLSWLSASIAQECSHPGGETHYDKRDECLGQAGEVAANDKAAPRFCAACVFGGAAVSVVRPAAIDLADRLTGLTNKVAYRVVGADRYSCPVSYSDIRGLVQIFADEQRWYDKSLPYPAEVALFFERETSDAPGAVVFGIFWRGSTKRRGGTHGAGAAMSVWKREQMEFQRPVAWVGRWLAKDGGVLEFEAHAGDVSPRKFAGGDLLEEVRSSFLKRGFTFGYVAVFDIPANGGHG